MSIPVVGGVLCLAKRTFPATCKEKPESEEAPSQSTNPENVLSTQLLEAKVLSMDLLKQQLHSKANLVQAVSGCSPVPDRPQRGSEIKVAIYLMLVHGLHSTLRYIFQCVEMRSPSLQIEPEILVRDSKLCSILSRIATQLMASTKCASLELSYLGVAKSSSELITVLINVYNAFLQYPPSFRPIDTGNSIVASRKECVLGWSRFARSSLPLAEAALVIDSRTAGYIGAPMCLFWQSRILNAITVSPGQGQREWLALVSDTLAELDEGGLSWAAYVRDECSQTFPGSHSLVIHEIVMTNETIDRPNELYRWVNRVRVNFKGVEYIYSARRELSLLRLGAGVAPALQPAPPARTMLSRIRRAMTCEDPQKRRTMYERWIGSEWDAPSILVNISDIRKIVMHLDPDITETHMSDTIIRALVVDHRGLKSVCARARNLARTALSRIGPLLPDAIFNDVSEARMQSAELLQAYEVLLTELTGLDGVIGLVLDGSRVIGTDVQAIERPRCLWDLVFNVTIEASYSTQPWIAVSHSWAQADGNCLCAVNERANFIPWATRTDLNNVRVASLRSGYTMAWMDKVCLRQRGKDGFDSALRRLEWFTDIPFIDVAYRKASKILVYLEGAGRPIRHQSTFRAGTSWLFRKWTAQETPAEIEIALGSGDECVKGDFFELCNQAIGEWHQEQHLGRCVDTDACLICSDLRKRLVAVQALRELPIEASASQRLHSVWEVMKGRDAGTDADHTFSLLSLLDVQKRPRYDPHYTRAQAVEVVKKSLKPSLRDALQAKANAHLFDGAFLTSSGNADERLNTLLAAFCPVTALGNAPSHYKLQGVLSAGIFIQMYLNGDPTEILKSSIGDRRVCACQRCARKLIVGPADIYGDFFIWHGFEACCAAAFDNIAREADKDALHAASHFLLSANSTHCALLYDPKASCKDGGAYQINLSEDSPTYSTSASWVFKAPGSQIRHHICELVHASRC